MQNLYKHQENLIKINPRYHLLAWEVGTGKTLTAIKLAENNARIILVVCPKMLVENWKREIKKWKTKESKWIIVSKEQFRKNWEHYAKAKVKGLIIDEAHFFAGYKSQMHKNAVKYLKKVRPHCVYLLTGTPYLSTPYNIMALENLLGRQARWVDYTAKYFQPVMLGMRLIHKPKQNCKEELAEIIADMGSTIRKDLCLDLPDQIYMQEDFDLTRDQRSFMNQIKEHPLIAQSHIVYWTKTHQILGGTLKIDEKIYKFNSEKKNRIIELTKERKKMAIICRYNAELEMLNECIPNSYILNGKTQDRQSLIDKANKADTCYLLINSAVSEGYNLTGFDYMVFYSHGFSFKDYEQMKGRIHRIGQENKCIYVDFIVKDSIDKDVIKSLKNKEDFQLAIYKK